MKIRDLSPADFRARLTGDGLRLAANVAAMLLALLALLAGVDFVLQMVGSIGPIQRVLAEIGIAKLDLRSILGLILSPLAWFMGVEGCDVRTFGGLLGEKIVLTEFVAYSSLADIMHSANPMHYRSEVIATYALCGFANFGSIAIQLGGIGGIAPNRRKELAQLGLRAMIAGALASFQTAAVAGILL